MILFAIIESATCHLGNVGRFTVKSACKVWKMHNIDCGGNSKKSAF